MKPLNNPQTSPDDLDYLAELGFEKEPVSEEDMRDLQNRIDHRIMSKKIPLTRYGGWLTLTMFFVVFCFWGYKELNHSQNETKANKINLPPVAAEETNKKTEKGASNNVDAPMAYAELPIYTVYPKEHFTKKNTAIHFEEDMMLETMQSKAVTTIGNKNNIRDSREILKLLPNAPVVYFYDLKVSNFQRYYFKNKEPNLIHNAGLSAVYENAENDKPETKSYEVFLTADKVLKEALRAFSLKEYITALKLFQVLLDLNKQDANALFYSGLSCYELNEANKALGFFEQVLQNENNVFDQEAEWYKALTLYKNDKPEEAKLLFVKISNDKGFYAARAGDKLMEIKAGSEN